MAAQHIALEILKSSRAAQFTIQNHHSADCWEKTSLQSGMAAREVAHFDHSVSCMVIFECRCRKIHKSERAIKLKIQNHYNDVFWEKITLHCGITARDVGITARDVGITAPDVVPLDLKISSTGIWHIAVQFLKSLRVAEFPIHNHYSVDFWGESTARYFAARHIDVKILNKQCATKLTTYNHCN